MYGGINLSCSSFPRELPVPLALERNAELARSQLGFANRFAFMGDINIPSHPPSLFPAKQKIGLLGDEGIGIGDRDWGKGKKIKKKENKGRFSYPMSLPYLGFMGK